MATTAPGTSQFLTVSGAARVLGVHANTVRSWTEQGLLGCLRINERGDRRYARDELDRFLAAASGGATAGMSESLVELTAALCARAADPHAAISGVARLLCSEGGYDAATWVAADSSWREIHGHLRPDRRLVRQAIRRGTPVVRNGLPTKGSRPSRAMAAMPVVDGAPLGVLLLSRDHAMTLNDEQRTLTTIGGQLDMSVRLAERIADAHERTRRAELLMAVGSDLGRQLDPASVLQQLVDRTAEMFGANHAAIFTRNPDGSVSTQATRNLSAEFCQCVEHASSLPVTTMAFEERRIVSAPDYVDDPRAHDLRIALLHEGINTVTVAPLLSGTEPLGVLALYHDTRYVWSAEDLSLFERLAEHGATIVRNAQNYSRMATWAAQLHSIQQLGTRLTRLRTVNEIGQTICSELNQLIECHNIRVYRTDGDDCVPVAWRGEVGEYEDEDGEQLRLKVGEGITGWVARYGLAQNLGNAAADRRAKTIPGTDDDLDESLLLAPMLFDDEVIGVIVLAKLDLNQFSPDDLRLLEIYASIAAQAMANADGTERLRAQSEALARQLNSQRELLRVTESILTTLDAQTLLQEIAERLQALIHVDNIAVSVHDSAIRRLRSIFARGVYAPEFLAMDLPDDEGVSGEVIRTGEALLVQDELNDPRVKHFESLGPKPGALIIAPLRSGEGVQGLLTIERLGADARFSDEEFDLVKLFAAHVSIALRNAAAHRAVELRAETDRLTGLWNHGALTEQIERLVDQRTRFSMLMVDLDFFKRYNDHLGHQAGNVMLQRVAGVLRDSCRDSDLVFRFGGDEFAVLLPNTGLAGARTVAEKVHAAVARVNVEGVGPVPVTCSVGIGVYPKDGHDATSVIIAADRACYAGKRAGRDRIATAAEGLALATDFRPTEPTPVELPEPTYSAA